MIRVSRRSPIPPPTGTTVDGKHRLADSLAHYWLMRGSFKDVDTRKPVHLPETSYNRRVIGNLGESYLFNGSRVAVPSGDLVRGYPFTISMVLWRPAGGFSNGPIISVYGTGHSAIVGPFGGHIEFGTTQATANNNIIQASDLPVGRIHLVHVARADGQQNYINGRSVANIPGGGGASWGEAGRTQSYLASRTSGDSYIWTGEVKDLCIFDGELSAADVLWLYENPYGLFERKISIPALASGSTPQLLAPTGRLAGSAWSASSGGTTYSCVDETSPDEADYAYTATAGAWEEFTFDTPDSGHNGDASGGYVRYRLPAGSGAVTVELKQGSTVLETWGPHTLTGSLQAFEQPITATTSDSSDLRVRFTAS